VVARAGVQGLRLSALGVFGGCWTTQNALGYFMQCTALDADASFHQPIFLDPVPGRVFEKHSPVGRWHLQFHPRAIQCHRESTQFKTNATMEPKWNQAVDCVHLSTTINLVSAGTTRFPHDLQINLEICPCGMTLFIPTVHC
jgi:hypothetical protein